MEDADIELKKLQKNSSERRLDEPGHREANKPHLPTSSSNTELDLAHRESGDDCTTEGARSDVVAVPYEEQPQDRPDAVAWSRLSCWDRVRFVRIIGASSGDVRDHLALDRTWLAYNRTANTLVSYAVVVAQLFVLHEDKQTLGRICGTIMICRSMTIEVIAGLRYLQQSHALVRRTLRQERVEQLWAPLASFSVQQSLVALAWDYSC